MAWVISLVTIVSMELMVRKRRSAWVLSILNQGLWLWLIVSTRQWGLLPLNLCMWIQAVRGLIRWSNADESLPIASRSSPP